MSSNNHGGDNSFGFLEVLHDIETGGNKQLIMKNFLQ